MKLVRIGSILVLAMLFGPLAQGQGMIQYWDPSTNTGYQHGDGSWTLNSADANWTTNGKAPLGGWINDNAAYFNGAAGDSAVLLTGAGVSASELRVNGTRYDIVITNGGELAVSGLFQIGYSSGSSSNNRFTVMGGEGVTSLCSAVGATVSYAGKGNELVVDGGGFNGSAVFTNKNDFLLGYTHASSMEGRVTVRRGGRLATSGAILLGRSSDGNELTVSEGGAVEGAVYIGNGSNGGNSNTLCITDPGTVVEKVGVLLMGASRRGNKLVVANSAILTNVTLFRVGDNASVDSMLLITNGGKMFTASDVDFGYRGSVACSGLVSGADSLWNLGAKIVNLGGATNNILQVGDAGMISNVGAFRIGVLAAARANGLVVTGGGRLYSKGASAVGYAAGAADNTARITGAGSLWDLGGQNLSIGSAAMSANGLTIEEGGAVSSVNLLLVATNNTVNLAGGILQAGRIGFTNDAAFAVGDGVQAALLVLTNTGRSGFSPGLRIENQAGLQGSATLECGPAGLVLAAGGTLSPGIGGIGCFTNNGTVTLQAGSESRFELAAATAPGTGWDFLAVTNGALALGGALKPVLRGDFVPAASDRFLIMTNAGAASVSGSFDNAAHGQAVIVYGEDGETEAGLLSVELGDRGVVLSAFREYRGGGTLMLIN